MNLTGAPNRFCAHEHREYLADAAGRLLRDREQGYPGFVAAGKLTAAEAADGIRRAECIAAQWRWIVDPAQPPLPPFDDATAGHFGAPSGALAADLATASARARTLADRRAGDPVACVLADLYAALAWLQRGDRIVIWVDLERRFPRPSLSLSDAA